tara:strand:- start:891 stop:1022 length:132 start_codon:yes stop_codon:yes gene_type:complete
MENSTEALERLHDEIRREKLEEQRKVDEEEWIRMQTTGGGAET